MVDQRVLDLIKKVGMEIIFPDIPVKRWDGRFLTITAHDSESELIHEIAHYLVASDELKKEPNYGLGMSNDSFERRCNPVHPKVKDPYDDESSASLLGILIERQFGMDYKKTLREHNWYDLSGTPRYKVKTEVKKLRGIGLVQYFTPVCLL